MYDLWNHIAHTVSVLAVRRTVPYDSHCFCCCARAYLAYLVSPPPAPPSDCVCVCLSAIIIIYAVCAIAYASNVSVHRIRYADYEQFEQHMLHMGTTNMN